MLFLTDHAAQLTPAAQYVCTAQRRRLLAQRSLLRRIAALLPFLDVRRRVHWHVPARQYRDILELRDGQRKRKSKSLPSSSAESECVATLADMEFINDRRRHNFRVWRNATPGGESPAVATPDKDIAQPRLSPRHPPPQASSAVPSPSSAKISALEVELAKLREQIAMIVTAQMSAPAPAFDAPPAPGGPPPPPPPLPPLFKGPAPLVIVKKNKTVNGEGGSQRGPNMSDVLKDLGKVQLRKSERSPGGTPIRRPPEKREATNPADLIAQALRRKFAHRHTKDTAKDDENKENAPVQSSPSQEPAVV